MIVSQLDAHGYFVAAVMADESPLEPGVYLIPGGAVDIPPPSVQPGKRAKLVGDGWAIEDLPSEPGDDAGDPPSVDPVAALQSLAKSALSESDITVIRCAEAGVPVPLAWRDYRAALRLIVSSDVGDPEAGLPARPEYPPGT